MKDIRDAGYNALLSKSSGTAVLPSAGLSSSDVADFLDTLTIDETLEISVTTSGGTSTKSGTTTTSFTKKIRRTPPVTFVFKVETISGELVYRPLPLYKFTTTLEPITGSFFVTEWAKAFVRPDNILIQAQDSIGQTTNYIAYIVSDRREI